MYPAISLAIAETSRHLIRIRHREKAKTNLHELLDFGALAPVVVTALYIGARMHKRQYWHRRAAGYFS